MTPRGPARFRVRFAERQLLDDLEHSSPEARDALRNARARLERDGIDAALLRSCESEHRDGTSLGGLVKVYLPIERAGEGPWGLVLAAARDQDGIYLRPIAFGARHPQRRPSVYDLAHYRQHGRWPEGMRKRSV